ncbi:MAG: branched-chain amino acid ABC transporter permease [Rhodobacteraceae bacterium]|nr:branched-chain amino acid ABC transporter permease [Paracoccaceae bacterium]
MEAVNALVLLGNYVIVPGLAYGSQLGLSALGVTLIYGVLRFSNFAHGDTMAFGAMIALLVTWLLQSMEISIAPLPTALLALPVAIAGTALLVLAFDYGVYRHFRRVKASPVVFVIASTGVMFVMQGLIRFIVGPNDRNLADGSRFIVRARDFKDAFGLNEGLAIKASQVLTLGITIVLVLWLFWFLHRTKTGKAMRAYADNEDLARLSGISPQTVVMLAWTLTAALATTAGVLYGLDKTFKPLIYFHLLLPTFAAAIVGGLGNPLGALAGGFIVAFSEIGITYAYKRFLVYILPESMEPAGLVQLLSTEYKFAVSFFILVVVLLVRPTGIFAGRSA